MKVFTKLVSDFWIDYNNTALVSLGADTQLMALYLLGNSHHNMLGIYYLPVAYIANDMKLSPRKVRSAIQKLCTINYCAYDEKTQYVWVRDMVLTQFGENIEAKDNRTKSLQAMWKDLPSCIPFLEEFYHKYQNILALDERKFVGSEVKIANNEDVNAAPPDAPPRVINPIFESTSKDAPSTLDDTSSDISVTSEASSPLQGILEVPLKDLRSSFEAPSDPLRSSSEAPSKELRSNKEVRSKNEEVDVRKKNEDEKESKVLIPNIVADATLIAVGDISVGGWPQVVSEGNSVHSIAECQTSSPPPSLTKLPSQVQAIFEHWKSTMRKPKSKLDAKRKSLMLKALNLGYSTEEICNAITGCSFTPHNMGQNDRGQRYDGLHVILRDADQIDRFIENCHCPPKDRNKAQQHLYSNLQAANAWLEGDYAGDLKANFSE